MEETNEWFYDDKIFIQETVCTWLRDGLPLTKFWILFFDRDPTSWMVSNLGFHELHRISNPPPWLCMYMVFKSGVEKLTIGSSSMSSGSNPPSSMSSLVTSSLKGRDCQLVMSNLWLSSREISGFNELPVACFNEGLGFGAGSFGGDTGPE